MTDLNMLLSCFRKKMSGPCPPFGMKLQRTADGREQLNGFISPGAQDTSMHNARAARASNQFTHGGEVQCSPFVRSPDVRSFRV